MEDMGRTVCGKIGLNILYEKCGYFSLKREIFQIFIFLLHYIEQWSPYVSVYTTIRTKYCPMTVNTTLLKKIFYNI